jgi:hypothetical protein
MAIKKGADIISPFSFLMKRLVAYYLFFLRSNPPKLSRAIVAGSG